MKNKIKPIILGISIILFYTIIYIFSFKISIVDILLYKGIIHLGVITIILIISLLILKEVKNNIFDSKDIVIITLSFTLLNLLFFCMVPVTLERSISVFMLNDIQKNENMTQKDIQDSFIQKYIYEFEAFEKRLNEQMVTGTLNEENGQYSLSTKGSVLLRIFKFINNIYNVQSKFF